MEPKIYQLIDDREAHMVGDYVGVVWNTSMQKKRLKGEDGITYTAEVPVREGDPYIDFLTIREEEAGEEGEMWADEDSPAEGGLDVKTAEKMAAELLLAVEYMQSLGK